jgi:hypothetical protein
MIAGGYPKQLQFEMVGKGRTSVMPFIAALPGGEVTLILKRWQGAIAVSAAHCAVVSVKFEPRSMDAARPVRARIIISEGG